MSKNTYNLRIKKNMVLKTESKTQAKIREMPMPLEVMDSLFDITKTIGYETTEEKVIREQKEAYDQTIIDRIAKLPLTGRQREVFELMYKKGETMTNTAKILGLGITTIQKIKEGLFKKIKKNIAYNFVPEEE